MYAKKKEGWTHDLAVQGRCVQTWGLEFGSQHTHTTNGVYVFLCYCDKTLQPKQLLEEGGYLVYTSIPQSILEESQGKKSLAHVPGNLLFSTDCWPPKAPGMHGMHRYTYRQMLIR